MLKRYAFDLTRLVARLYGADGFVYSVAGVVATVIAGVTALPHKASNQLQYNQHCHRSLLLCGCCSMYAAA